MRALAWRGPLGCLCLAGGLYAVWACVDGVGWTRHTQALVGMGHPEEALLGAVAVTSWLLWIVLGAPLVMTGVTWACIESVLTLRD